MNLSGIEVKRLLERSRLSKESILQRRGRKSEEQMENPGIEILVMEEFPELQLTPFHEHGSFLVSHDKAETLRSSETLDMMVTWFGDS
jgi:hypothetical protein